MTICIASTRTSPWSSCQASAHDCHFGIKLTALQEKSGQFTPLRLTNGAWLDHGVHRSNMLFEPVVHSSDEFSQSRNPQATFVAISSTNDKIVYTGGGSDSELGMGTYSKDQIKASGFVCFFVSFSPRKINGIQQKSRLSSSHHVRADSRWTGLSKVPNAGEISIMF